MLSVVVLNSREKLLAQGILVGWVTVGSCNGWMQGGGGPGLQYMDGQCGTWNYLLLLLMDGCSGGSR